MKETRASRSRPGLASMAVLAASMAFAMPARAEIVTITFDPGDPIGGLPVGAVLANQYAAFGVVFTPNAFSGTVGAPTGLWATNTTMTIASSTGGDVGALGTPALVSGNLLRSFSGWLTEDGDPSFTALFSVPVVSFSATFAGIGAFPSDNQLFAYSGSTLVGYAVATTSGQQTLTVNSVAPITSVIITPGAFDDWVGVDNITFNAIPEPSPMMLAAAAGLPAVLVVAARRRRAAA